ncbi:MAG: hypothetical protein ACI9PN_002255, partial [Candidatus Azotimanducaceae bacterium]
SVGSLSLRQLASNSATGKKRPKKSPGARFARGLVYWLGLLARFAG